MIFRRTLALAVENRRLRRANQDLSWRLTRALVEVERLHVSLQRIARNVDMVACMARDPRVASEFVRDAQRIAELPEAEGKG